MPGGIPPESGASATGADGRLPADRFRSAHADGYDELGQAEAAILADQDAVELREQLPARRTRPAAHATSTPPAGSGQVPDPVIKPAPPQAPPQRNSRAAHHAPKKCDNDESDELKHENSVKGRRGRGQAPVRSPAGSGRAPARRTRPAAGRSLARPRSSAGRSPGGSGAHQRGRTRTGCTSITGANVAGVVRISAASYAGGRRPARCGACDFEFLDHEDNDCTMQPYAAIWEC